MLKEARKIERNMVAKLNCMYFAAKKVSMSTIDFMMRKEEEMGGECSQMYLDFSQKLNDLINLYFQAKQGDDIELKIAGN
jgi:hypothetical protein